MGEFPGERGLAVTAGAPQRRGDGDGIAFTVEKPLLQRIKLNRPLHEIGRWLRRHHRDAVLPALVLEAADQSRDMLGVFAEFETNLRRERQLEGIAKAKAAGVYKGRKPTISGAVVAQLRAAGLGPSAIAERL